MYLDSLVSFQLLFLKHPVVEEKEHHAKPNKDDKYSYANALTKKHHITEGEIVGKVYVSLRTIQGQKIQKLGLVRRPQATCDTRKVVRKRCINETELKLLVVA